MNTRILFTDLDGTLLNDQKEITSGNQNAIDQALAQGHKIVIATGRPLAGAWPQAEQLGLTREGCYIICFNGGQIYDCARQMTLFGKSIPKPLVREVFQKAQQAGIHIQTYTDTHVVSEHLCPELLEYSATTRVLYRILSNIPEELPDAPHKMLAIASHNRLEQFRQQILAEYTGALDAFFSNDTYLEFVPFGVSKGFAVHWMCDYLGIPLEYSVAAGDAQNDIPMLKAAHIGAVMRNAFPGIEQYGNYQTSADNNHDGVAEIIHRFILNQNEA